MNEEVEAAYQRGLRDGEISAVREAATRAHERLDKIDPRITALERVMYAGMGIVFLIQIFPVISDMMQKGAQ